MSDESSTSESTTAKRGVSGRLLLVIFFVALVMGAGPGVFLVNGRGPILGMPAVYAWVVFWFFVEAATVTVAFCTIWKSE